MNHLMLLLAVFAWYSCARRAACADISNESKTSETESSKEYQSESVTAEDLKRFARCNFQTPQRHLCQWKAADWVEMAKAYWEEKKGKSSIKFDDFEKLTHLEKIKEAVIIDYYLGSTKWLLRHPLLLEAVCRVRTLNDEDLTDIKEIVNDSELDVFLLPVLGCWCLFNLLPEKWKASQKRNMLYSMIWLRVFTAAEVLDLYDKVNSDINISNLDLIINAINFDRCDVFNAAFSRYCRNSKIDYDEVFEYMLMKLNYELFEKSQFEMLGHFLKFVFSDEKANEYWPYLDDFIDELNNNIKNSLDANASNIRSINKSSLYIRFFLDDKLLDLIVGMLSKDCRLDFKELISEQTEQSLKIGSEQPRSTVEWLF